MENSNKFSSLEEENEFFEKKEEEIKNNFDETNGYDTEIESLNNHSLYEIEDKVYEIVTRCVDGYIKKYTDLTKEEIKFISIHGDHKLDSLLATLEDQYNSENNIEKQTEIYSTLIEFIFYTISSNQDTFEYSDKEIISKMIEKSKTNYNLSSILGGRDVNNCNIYSFPDSGLFLSEENSQKYINISSLLSYLNGIKRLNIDYSFLFGDKTNNIKAVSPLPLEKFTKDKQGVCYYIYYFDKGQKGFNSTYINRFLAVLSFVKYNMFKKYKNSNKKNKHPRENYRGKKN